ncbi:MAG: class A beta-lactamase-related serine hydrolase [Chloroflexota bacterium]|nr:class A beta-lactamase-related serine hydrolase [Chloroflexota bacterium]
MASAGLSAVALAVTAITVITAIVITGTFIRDVYSARRPASAAALGGAAAPPLSSDVVRRLDALVAAFPGTAGVWIGDPAGAAALYARGADISGASASLYKLGVLFEAERRVESGELRYGDPVTIAEDDVSEQGSIYEAGTVITIDAALEAMITVSDNGAALALWHRLGGVSMEARLARAGLGDLHITLDANGDTLATARAIGTFFRLIARRELVSGAASDRMLARLERQKINDRLPARLPAGVVVAHKTGNLPGVTHDAGIIVTPSGPRIVVVMTWDAGGPANALIAAIGAAVYDASRAAVR